MDYTKKLILKILEIERFVSARQYYRISMCCLRTFCILLLYIFMLSQYFSIILCTMSNKILPYHTIYEIGKWLICKDGNANLYNLGVNATQ